MSLFWMRFVKMDQTGDGTGGGSGAGGSAGAAGAGGDAGAGAGAGGSGAGSGTSGSGAGTGSGTGEQGAGTKPPLWPENWRQQMVGGDEKELKQIERYLTPADVWKKARALEQRLSSGEFKAVSAFPEKGTDAEKSAWRAENGVPESPEKYDLNVGDGLVVGEEDKPIIDDFLKHAHANNVPQSSVKAFMGWYFNFQEKRLEERAAADQQATQIAQDALRTEWGSEYRGNVNRIVGMLDIAPAGVKDKIMNARAPDGTPLFADADAIRWFANMARELNPATTLVPGAGGNVAGAVDDEIGKLEKMMGDRGSEYWKGPNADKNQERLRQLYAAREGFQKRNG